MDTLQQSLDVLARHLLHIKWMLAAVLFLVSVAAALIVYVAIGMVRQVKGNIFESEFFNERSRDLLDRDEADKLIAEASERIATHPCDGYAHWYLGQAYYRKRDWFRALKEFRSLSQITPAWREQHVEPWIKDIEAKLREPDSAKDTEEPV